MNIGLKLWSTNTDYYLEEARRLYRGHWFDYIELCVVPGSLATLDKWQQLKEEEHIPFALHAPHSMLGVNLADKANENKNIAAYHDVELFNQGLQAKYTVVHAGVNGTIEETIRQLNLIQPKNILLENKPYKSIYGEPICRGAIIEEVMQVLENYNCLGFCLDIGHAICTANALGKEPYLHVEELGELNPLAYHLSDNFIDSEIDHHLHLGTGNINIKRIIKTMEKNKDVAIETIKSSKTELQDFCTDCNYLLQLQ